MQRAGADQKGFKLDNVRRWLTALRNKTFGFTAQYAPVQWQRGEIGHVIDYCIADVACYILAKIMQVGCISHE